MAKEKESRIQLQSPKQASLKEAETEALIVIAVQKKGMATVPEIVEKVAEYGLKLTETQTRRSCQKIKDRGLFSVTYDSSGGLAIEAYKLAKAVFSIDIPIAHYKDICDYPEVKGLVDELEEKKDVNKGRRPDICDYYDCQVSWEVQDRVLGFMPFTEQKFLQHYRDGEGNIIFTPAHFYAYLRENMRLINIPESSTYYIGTDYGTVDFKGRQLGKEQFIVEERGYVTYESIPPGSEITTTFRVPATMMAPEKFQSFLTSIGQRPLKGFGGRSRYGGRLKLKTFNVTSVAP